ncbi:hypothetical protein HK103_003423 [Boothiomyces macroporosus]|uniref:Uncharacterized protein n=1 Tax=Boothiomyces macroporosus TaxID=261099 RepID=A0AAD5UI15_9FUNG|nr:hypothetical protein HK103_003423 [Boothiomyces macroporosus]
MWSLLFAYQAAAVSVGGHCGGFVKDPLECDEGLVCVLGRKPDRGGVCQYPHLIVSTTTVEAAPTAISRMYCQAGSVHCPPGFVCDYVGVDTGYCVPNK